MARNRAPTKAKEWFLHSFMLKSREMAYPMPLSLNCYRMLPVSYMILLYTYDPVIKEYNSIFKELQMITDDACSRIISLVFIVEKEQTTDS